MALTNATRAQPVRRQYSPEFKADAVRLVTQGGHRPCDVARQMGITTKILCQWRRQLAQQTIPEQAFVGPGNDRDAEVKRLQRRITLLEMEREILKKTIGIFAEPRAVKQ